MRIKKTLETSIRIQNPLSFCRDISGNVLSSLRRDLQGKCYRGCYIHSVDSIVKHSEAFVSTDSNRTDAKINVQFECTVSIFYRGETITGVTITHKDKGGILIGETPMCRVFMNYHKSLETITAGQIITVRVGATQYAPYTDKVAINAYPYLPASLSPLVYKIGAVSPRDAPMIEAASTRFNDAVKALNDAKAANPKGFQFFAELLGPYKKYPPMPTGAKSVDVSMMGTTAIYVTHGLEIPFTDVNTVYVYDKLPTGLTSSSQHNAAQSICALYDECADNAKTLSEMTILYTPEMIKSHRNYWMVLLKSKLDA